MNCTTSAVRTTTPVSISKVNLTQTRLPGQTPAQDPKWRFAWSSGEWTTVSQRDFKQAPTRASTPTDLNARHLPRRQRRRRRRRNWTRVTWSG